jgi:hypothetical protein
MMAKLRSDLQHREEEGAPVVDPALAAAVAAQLSAQATAQVGAPVTIAPEQVQVIPPASVEDVEEARRKIREMFRAADAPPESPVAVPASAVGGGAAGDAGVGDGAVPAGDGGVAAVAPKAIALVAPTDHGEFQTASAAVVAEATIDPLRLQIITDLVKLMWKHSDAVWVADRTFQLMEEHGIGWEYAKDNAIYEFHKKDAPEPPIVPVEKTRGAAPVMEKVYGPTTDQEADQMLAARVEAGKAATVDAVQAVQQDASQLTAGDPNELVQIIHNLQRDVARLAKLWGLEGVKKTRKKKDE